jgi:hypothetical protein
MELEIFNPSRKLLLGNRRPTFPYFTIHPKGLCRFNYKAIELMELTTESVVVFARYPDAPKDWYVLVNPPIEVESKKITLRFKVGDKLNLLFGHVKLVHAIHESCDMPMGKFARNLIIGQPSIQKVKDIEVKAFPIITKSMK